MSNNIKENERAQPIRSRGERLEVSSQLVFVIDQFMLANRQFLAQLELIGDANLEQSKLSAAIAMFGGCLCSLPSGKFLVFRDPYQAIVVIHPEQLFESLSPEQDEDRQGDLVAQFDLLIGDKDQCLPIGRLFVDTRCMVIADASMLLDRELLAEYANLRNSQQDKKARDLLRSHGAAVRYGFNRQGDELGVFKIEAHNLIVLWPEVSLD